MCHCALFFLSFQTAIEKNSDLALHERGEQLLKSNSLDVVGGVGVVRLYIVGNDEPGWMRDTGGRKGRNICGMMKETV